MRGEELAKDLGPLPPTKVHCTSLVEGALRQALDPASVGNPTATAPATASPPVPAAAAAASAPSSLMDSFNKPDVKKGGVKVVFLRDESAPTAG